MKRIVLTLTLLLCAAGARAEHFQFTDLDGAAHSLQAHHGKWLLVNVWATWCAPCIKEMPELQALSRARPDLVVLGVAADGAGRAAVQQFAQRLGVTYPLVAGDMNTMKELHLRAYPSSLLYDPDGNRVLLKEGQVSRAEIEALLPH
ncbi:MAG: TlpA family protein disulfide reductase [Telluria sp.]